MFGMTEQLIQRNKKYRLNDFKEILQELLVFAEQFENLKGKHILELGPGTKLNLFNFLKNESGAASVRAAGKTVALQKSQAKTAAVDSYLLPFIKKQKAKSFDVIYARHVFEKNSIHPLLLITHPAYRRAIMENRFDTPGVDFPSSFENMQAVFKQAYRILKPGGIIISQIAKRKNSVLTDAFLSKLKPAEIRKRELGRFSEIVTVVK